MKYNIIIHVTTSCNYDCSYCDVIKDKRFLRPEQRENILSFIKKNHKNIQRFKFFGGEPLIAFHDMKYIIKKSCNYIGNNFETVTNTTFLKEEVGEYLQEYFSHVFFSIDSENDFNYEKVLDFTEKYRLEKKLYFNLIVSPGKEHIASEQFYRLYDLGIRGFNILPVYFTQSWTKKNLSCLGDVMKKILNLSLSDPTLRLYGFQENQGYDTSLANNTLFIDIDGKIYYSDMVSTFSGQKIKNKLYLGDIESFEFNSLGEGAFKNEKYHIGLLEEAIYKKTSGQRELHKLMDYFSLYLNHKNY